TRCGRGERASPLPCPTPACATRCGAPGPGGRQRAGLVEQPARDGDAARIAEHRRGPCSVRGRGATAAVAAQQRRGPAHARPAPGGSPRALASAAARLYRPPGLGGGGAAAVVAGGGGQLALTPGPSRSGRGERRALTPSPSPRGRGERAFATC